MNNSVQNFFSNNSTALAGEMRKVFPGVNNWSEERLITAMIEVIRSATPPAPQRVSVSLIRTLDGEQVYHQDIELEDNQSVIGAVVSHITREIWFGNSNVSTKVLIAKARTTDGAIQIELPAFDIAFRTVLLALCQREASRGNVPGEVLRFFKVAVLEERFQKALSAVPVNLLKPAHLQA